MTDGIDTAIKVARKMGFDAYWDGVLVLKKDGKEYKIDDPEFYKMLEKLDMIDFFANMHQTEEYVKKYLKSLGLEVKP